MKSNGFRIFLFIVTALFLLRILMPSLSVPLGLVAPLAIGVGILFIAGPILGLFLASKEPWDAVRSLSMIFAGLVLHAGSVALGRGLKGGFLPTLLDATAQTGLLFWCCGLGALLALLIKDKNIMVPLAVFLAGFDAFLIFSPESLPRKIMASAPKAFEAVAAKVPTVVQTTQGTGQVAVGAYVGPADFIFLTMFFMAIFKFKMKTQQTLAVMIPVLVAYMFTVLVFGGVNIGPISLAQLPALVPIGLTVLLVNASEFKMKTDEKVATLVVALIAVGLAWLGIRNAQTARLQPAPPAEPSKSVPAPKPEGSAR